MLGPVDAFSKLEQRSRVVRHPDSAVFTDLGELGAFHAVGRVAELPELDMVGELESLEEDGDFVGVRASVVGVKNEGFDISRHLAFGLGVQKYNLRLSRSFKGSSKATLLTLLILPHIY